MTYITCVSKKQPRPPGCHPHHAFDRSCHDIDLILGFMGDDGTDRSGDRCTSVVSFGGLTHFRKARKPAAAGAALRCLDCPMEQQCPYSAPRLYFGSDGAPTRYMHAPVSHRPITGFFPASFIPTLLSGAWTLRSPAYSHWGRPKLVTVLAARRDIMSNRVWPQPTARMPPWVIAASDLVSFSTSQPLSPSNSTRCFAYLFVRRSTAGRMR